MARMVRDIVIPPRQHMITVYPKSWAIIYVDVLVGLPYELNVRIDNSGDRVAFAYFELDEDGDPRIDMRGNESMKWKTVEHERPESWYRSRLKWAMKGR